MPAPDVADALVSRSPATGEALGTVPRCAPGDVEAVAAEVRRVQPFWAALSFADRGRYLKRLAAVVLDEATALSALVAREAGRPRAEAHVLEVLPTVDALHWVANEGAEVLGDERVKVTPLLLAGRRAAATNDPVGVIGLVTPWTEPWAIPLAGIAAALMGGNGVVLKPSPHAALTAERLVAAAEKAGLPGGLVRVVHGGDDVGAAVVAADGVDRVIAVGSTATGRAVAEACAARLRPAVLGLGSSDAALVLADADVDRAAEGIAAAAFGHAGQACGSIRRVLVAREVAERFTAALVAAAARLRPGDPERWETELGPLRSAAALDRATALAEEAEAAGAVRRCGGPASVEGLAGAWLRPVVLEGAAAVDRLAREEVLAPVVGVEAVRSEREAIARANATPFGLGASVWTADRAKGERIARELLVGMVWLDDHRSTHAAVAADWGGIRASGTGRLHGRAALEACVNRKLVARDAGRLRPLAWPPYDEALGLAANAIQGARFGREQQRLGALRRGAGPLVRSAERLVRRPRPR